MVNLPFAILKSARPRQWVKNLSIFAALIFTGQFFEPNMFDKTIWGFVLLSIIVSSVYFINDIADIKSDRLHPFKKNRPIAKGDLPVPIAIFLAISGIVFSLSLSSAISEFFFYALLAYLILQLAYTFILKEAVVLDILAIATGFVLRVYAGAFLIDAHLSVWFLLCVISVSLFLAAGKRRAELAILHANVASQHRKTLSMYTPDLLDSYLAMFATASEIIGDYDEATAANTTITNIGNTILNIQLSGTNLSSGSSAIGVSRIQYTFSGSYNNSLAGTLSNAKQTKQALSFRLNVPAATAPGNYTGTITLIAVKS